MSRKKTYLSLFFPVLLLAAGVIFRQIYVMGKELKQEEQSWKLTAESMSGEISEETLQTMCTFSGLEEIWTVVSVQVGVEIDDYHASAEVQGVDLAGYPLEIVWSSGQKSMGRSPLFAAGEEFFDLLQDKNGEKISSRQKKILMENLEQTKAKIYPENPARESGQKTLDALGTSYNRNGGSETSGKTGRESSDSVEFLGIVQGSSLYMDQEQMKQWLMTKGIQPRVTKVCMQIRGKKRAEKARSDLEKAGFTVVCEISGGIRE